MSKPSQSVSLGKSSLIKNKEYKSWLKNLKQKVLQTQLKAAVQVNSTLLAFYWELGEEIVQRQTSVNWGDGFLKQLSKDMMTEFPDIKGFSERNLKYIRQWFLFYTADKAIGQQAVAQLVQVPWGHNIQIISKCQNVPQALYYVQNTLVIPASTLVIPASTLVIPASTLVIPASTLVIPAKAGNHRVSSNA